MTTNGATAATVATPARLRGVETRRFRTWETGAAVATGAWRIVFRYALERSRRTWYMGLLAVAAIVALIFNAGGLFSSDAGVVAADAMLLPLVVSFFFGAVVLMLVGAPGLAEDRRFNAPLLYFSKPLRPQSYLAGKAAHLGLLLGLLVVLPLALLLVVAFAASLGGGAPETSGYANSPEAQHEWRVRHIDAPGDALLAMVTLVPGVALGTAWCATVVMLASSYTSRAWHAALAALGGIAVPSLAGGILSGGVSGAFEGLFGPVQWLGSVIYLPWNLLFDPGADPYYGDVSSAYDGAGLTIVLAYALLIGTGYAAWRLTLRRVGNLEGLA